MKDRTDLNSSTSKIKKTLTINDILDIDGQHKWLSSHPDYNFYDLAKEENAFGLQAIMQHYLDFPYDNSFKQQKNEIEIRKNAVDALIRLAREGNLKSLNFLRKRVDILVGHEVHAYAMGLISCKQYGWKGSIIEVEKILNDLRKCYPSPIIITSDNTVNIAATDEAHATNKVFLDNKLNDTANAGAKGFLEGHPLHGKIYRRAAYDSG